MTTTITSSYGTTHDAFLAIASDERLVPFDVRLLVALAERGGTGRTDELERDMRACSSAIRRSSLTLRDRRLILASGADGGRVRQGVRAQLTLTARGRTAAGRAMALAATDGEA